MSVFAHALGPDFARLAPALQQFHAGTTPRHFIGQATIEHGHSIVAQAGIRLGGFPPPGHDIPFAITVTTTEQGENWARDFDEHKTGSTLRYDPARQQIIENLGHVTCALSLSTDAGQLQVAVTELWVFGLPIPTTLIPRSTSREWQDETGAFCFDIGARLPGDALLIRYHGRLMPQA